MFGAPWVQLKEVPVPMLHHANESYIGSIFDLSKMNQIFQTDIGASISVLSIPTRTILANRFLKRST